MSSALNIAKYLLTLVKQDEGDTLSNLKLQKLLYYIQGYYIAFFDKPIFDDEIEAWDLGPVVSDVYSNFKEFGNKCISTDNLKFDISMLTEEDRNFVNKIFSIYNDYSASSLVDMTHQEDPWKNVYKKYENNKITKDSLKKFFSDRIEKVFLKQVKEVLKDTDFSNIKNWEDYKFSDDN